MLDCILQHVGDRQEQHHIPGRPFPALYFSSASFPEDPVTPITSTIHPEPSYILIGDSSVCVCVYVCGYMCVHTCVEARSHSKVTLPGVSFLRRHSFSMYETGSLSGLKLSSVYRLNVQSTSGIHPLLPPLHWNPECGIVPRFSHGCWESNSGPHESMARTLLNEPSPNSFLVVDSPKIRIRKWR